MEGSHPSEGAVLNTHTHTHTPIDGKVNLTALEFEHTFMQKGPNKFSYTQLKISVKGPGNQGGRNTNFLSLWFELIKKEIQISCLNI